jgi:hypothetical protein
LTSAARRGHSLIDRALCLPRAWTEDRTRCRGAGVPDGVEFATKPTLATSMITRAVHSVPRSPGVGRLRESNPRRRRACGVTTVVALTAQGWRVLA